MKWRIAMKHETTGEVFYQEKVNENSYRMVLKTEKKVVDEAHPGQFIHLKISGSSDPLLRRPFSIHQVNRKQRTLTILYAVVGTGTGIMAAELPGKQVNLLGPLGTGFPSLPEIKKITLLGGGLGAAPLLFTAEHFCREGKQATVILGFPTKADVMLLHDFERAGAEVIVATDDGSQGFKGFPTAILEQRLNTKTDGVVLACGPRLMLQKTAEICQHAGVPAWLSMEERMACGVGACLGCVVRIRDNEGSHYEKACVDGPVFEASKVVFE
jgi:dihydroorotate dehydrogenase electron transfer subunit